MGNIINSLNFILIACVLATGSSKTYKNVGRAPLSDSSVFDNPDFGYTINLPDNIKKSQFSTDYIFVGLAVQSEPEDFEFIIITPDLTSMPDNLKRWKAQKLKIERINTTTVYIKTICQKAKSGVQFFKYTSENHVSYRLFHIWGIDSERRLSYDISRQIMANIHITQPLTPLKQRTQLWQEHKNHQWPNSFQSAVDTADIGSPLPDDGWGKRASNGNTKSKRDRLIRCMAEMFLL